MGTRSQLENLITYTFDVDFHDAPSARITIRALGSYHAWIELLNECERLYPKKDLGEITNIKHHFLYQRDPGDQTPWR